MKRIALVAVDSHAGTVGFRLAEGSQTVGCTVAEEEGHTTVAAAVALSAEEAERSRDQTLPSDGYQLKRRLVQTFVSYSSSCLPFEKGERHTLWIHACSVSKVDWKGN